LANTFRLRQFHQYLKQGVIMADAKKPSSGASDIKLHEFAEAVSAGVLRAVQTHTLGKGPNLPGHIIVGIIYDPRLGQVREVNG